MHEIVIIGNLGSDPEMRYTPSGQSVTSFSVASNRRWRNRDGETEEKTDWFRVSCWGNMAETANNYLEKGRQIYCRGRLEARIYDDRDGNTRISLDVTAFDIQFLGGGQQQDDRRDNSRDNRGGGQRQGNRQSGGGNRQQGGGNRQSGNSGNRNSGGNRGGGNRRQQQQDDSEDYEDEGDGGNNEGWDDVDDLPF